MYEHFYGLTSSPFDLTPNPRYLLLTPTHREALATLQYGITARKGITLLIGEAGTGKTTLLRKALAMKLTAAGATGADCVFITNPILSRSEFFSRLAFEFGLDSAAATSKTELLRQLEQTLVARRAAGRATALIVDEAQVLPPMLIEELRLLANIESDDEKLLPLVLAGQPELAERLNDHRLRQFRQRIVLRCRLNALDLQETATYIFGRVRLAGGDAARIFTREAVQAVYRASRGIPRTVSAICDNALLSGFAQQRRPVEVDIVDEVCRDMEVNVTGVPEVRSAAEELSVDKPHATPPRDASATGPVARTAAWPRSQR
jgi:general secretion pathway protein A